MPCNLTRASNITFPHDAFADATASPSISRAIDTANSAAADASAPTTAPTTDTSSTTASTSAPTPTTPSNSQPQGEKNQPLGGCACGASGVPPPWCVRGGRLLCRCGGGRGRGSCRGRVLLGGLRSAAVRGRVLASGRRWWRLLCSLLAIGRCGLRGRVRWGGCGCAIRVSARWCSGFAGLGMCWWLASGREIARAPMSGPCDS